MLVQVPRIPDFLARRRAQRKLEYCVRFWCHVKYPSVVIKVVTRDPFSRDCVRAWLHRLMSRFCNFHTIRNHWLNEARIRFLFSRVKLADVSAPTLGSLATNHIGFCRRLRADTIANLFSSTDLSLPLVGAKTYR